MSFGEKCLIRPENNIFYYIYFQNIFIFTTTDWLTTRKFSPQRGGFFLAPAEGCSLQPQQKGPKVILADEQTNGRIYWRVDNGFKGVRWCEITWTFLIWRILSVTINGTVNWLSYRGWWALCYGTRNFWTGIGTKAGVRNLIGPGPGPRLGQEMWRDRDWDLDHEQERDKD